MPGPPGQSIIMLIMGKNVQMHKRDVKLIRLRLFVMLLFIVIHRDKHRASRPRYFNTGSGSHFLHSHD